MKVIFLDIDGVLNSALDFFELRKLGHHINEKNYVMNRGLVCLLSEIIEKTDAKIVISSTWREMLSHDFIYDFMVKHDFSHPRSVVIGGTPCHRRGFSDNPRWHRGNEIHEYLVQHDVEKFIILDDIVKAIEDAGLGEHLIATNPEVGLTLTQCNKAKKMLGLTEYWQEEQRKSDEALAMLANCII